MSCVVPPNLIENDLWRYCDVDDLRVYVCSFNILKREPWKNSIQVLKGFERMISAIPEWKVHENKHGNKRIRYSLYVMPLESKISTELSWNLLSITQNKKLFLATRFFKLQNEIWYKNSSGEKRLSPAPEFTVWSFGFFMVFLVHSKDQS